MAKLVIPESEKNKTAINSRVYLETALKVNRSPEEIEDMFKIVCQFTAEVIKRGGYETVMWPRFGKFAANPRAVQFFAAKENPRSALEILLKDETI